MEEENNVQEPVAQKPAELTINDLTNVKSLIEMSVRRGAFNASELSAVGAAYDKLSNFLNSIQQEKK